MINLSNITLLAHTGRTDTHRKKFNSFHPSHPESAGLEKNDDIHALVRSIKHSMKGVSFGVVKIIAPAQSLELISQDCEGIELIECEPLDRIGYARYSVEKFNDHIDTDYCINVQEDGGIINPDLWMDAFLEYDYIGAPWLNNPSFSNLVGNGGFSLRSKKFLETAAKLTYEPEPAGPGAWCAPEDWFTCVKNHDHMKLHGIKFPSPRVAAQFSVEHPLPFHYYDREDVSTYGSFGFHASFNFGGMKELHGDP